MFYLSKKSSKILNEITKDINNDKRSKKIKNSDCFMPLSVELISADGEPEIFAIAHYRSINGDLCCDPEMTFLKKIIDEEVRFVPLAFEQSGWTYERSTFINRYGDVEKFRPQMLNAHKKFATLWLNNIKMQQGLGC